MPTLSVSFPASGQRFGWGCQLTAHIDVPAPSDVTVNMFANLPGVSAQVGISTIFAGLQDAPMTFGLDTQPASPFDWRLAFQPNLDNGAVDGASCTIQLTDSLGDISATWPFFWDPVSSAPALLWVVAQASAPACDVCGKLDRIISDVEKTFTSQA